MHYQSVSPEETEESISLLSNLSKMELLNSKKCRLSLDGDELVYGQKKGFLSKMKEERIKVCDIVILKKYEKYHSIAFCTYENSWTIGKLDNSTIDKIYNAINPLLGKKSLTKILEKKNFVCYGAGNEDLIVDQILDGNCCCQKKPQCSAVKLEDVIVFYPEKYRKWKIIPRRRVFIATKEAGMMIDKISQEEVEKLEKLINNSSAQIEDLPYLHIKKEYLFATTDGLVYYDFCTNKDTLPFFVYVPYEEIQNAFKSKPKGKCCNKKSRIGILGERDIITKNTYPVRMVRDILDVIDKMVNIDDKGYDVYSGRGGKGILVSNDNVILLGFDDILTLRKPVVFRVHCKKHLFTCELKFCGINIGETKKDMVIKGLPKYCYKKFCCCCGGDLKREMEKSPTRKENVRVDRY